LSGFDLAAIAVGHYELRGLMKNAHQPGRGCTGPPRAPRESKPYDSLRHIYARLTLEPLGQPLIDSAEARRPYEVSAEEFFVLRHGQTEVLVESETAKLSEEHHCGRPDALHVGLLVRLA
jgi:hypothetical protein